jgi:metal-responsive CopG/Arc/MetJ family transcriptional regulator
MEDANMKHHIGLTIDSKLFREIERLREREKRSTFIEHLIKLGLRVYKKEDKHETKVYPKNNKKAAPF